MALNGNHISIRVVSKRRERGAIVAAADETVIDCDRSNPVLGNRHYLRDHNDDNARAKVIAANKRDFDADVARNGPMSKAIDDIVARVLKGERIALRCWCAPRPCHCNTYVAEIRRRCEAVQRFG
jgi:hypothetical protein